MDYIRINPITESDFDSIVDDAGGSRIAQEDSADYVLFEAILELKLVDEEGLRKRSRQRKLAKLFREQQPDSPVVVVDPQSLERETARRYYNIVAGPIQTHVKKAASQLKKTRARFSESSVRVLILFNNGYSALNHEEFKSICFKCATNDTMQVDWLIVGGMYFYSDTFDHYVLTPLEPIPINLSVNFPSVEKLQMAWGNFIDNFMTNYVRDGNLQTQGKMPVLDLSFKVDQTNFVRPAPKMGKSEFWPEGERPRKNTTGIESCPPVAKALPFFQPSDWKKFTDLFPFETFFRESYPEWVLWVHRKETNWKDSMKPLVPVPVSYQEFENYINKPTDLCTISDLYECAAARFETMVRRVLDNIRDANMLRIVVPEYIYLEVTEIGQDKAYDLCSIYHVSKMLVADQRKVLVKKANIFFEYGIALASAYAVKNGVSTVIYRKHSVYS